MSTTTEHPVCDITDCPGYGTAHAPLLPHLPLTAPGQPWTLPSGERVTIVASSWYGGVSGEGSAYVEHDWWILLVLHTQAPFFSTVLVDPGSRQVIDQHGRVFGIVEAVARYVDHGGDPGGRS